MSWLGKIVGGGIGEVATALGGAAKDIEDVFRTSDREALDQYRAETERMQVAQAATQGQLDINREEARHPSIFVAGWRPAVGWICALAMGYHFILYPIAGPAVEQYAGFKLVDLAWQELSVILMGMLGFGGMRVVEKVKGVSRDRLR